MKIITNSMIVEMNDMYLKGKSYKIIANKFNISPYTVRKYIKNQKTENIPEKITFNKPLPKFNSKIFQDKDWGKLCVLDEIEIQEIRKLWEEMEF